MIKSSLTPPTIDQATIDYYVARGKRERSKVFGALFRAIFAAPQQIKVAPKNKTATA